MFVYKALLQGLLAIIRDQRPTIVRLEAN